jgi:transposase
MDEIGILPQFKGTLVRDGYLSYSRFEKCRHSLCNAHLLRELVFIEETDPEQRVWTRALASLLCKIKDAADLARKQEEDVLGKDEQQGWIKRYDQLVRKAVRLNPLLPRGKRVAGAPKKKRISLPTASRTAWRLKQKRDEVLRFMKDLTVPFDNNGSERDLRMIKLQQKISGCFRTEDGARNFCRVRSYLSTARKQGHSLLLALERAFNGKPLPFYSAELVSST